MCIARGWLVKSDYPVGLTQSVYNPKDSTSPFPCMKCPGGVLCLWQAVPGLPSMAAVSVRHGHNASLFQAVCWLSTGERGLNTCMLKFWEIDSESQHGNVISLPSPPPHTCTSNAHPHHPPPHTPPIPTHHPSTHPHTAHTPLSHILTDVHVGGITVAWTVPQQTQSWQARDQDCSSSEIVAHVPGTLSSQSGE